jgi:hypothetical protein
MAGTRKTCYNRKVFQLTNEHNQKVEMEVQKVLHAMKLKALHNNLAPTRTGGIPLADNKLSRYEKHFDSLYFFFSHVYDFESLLMLVREPLEYFPSMNPTSLVENLEQCQSAISTLHKARNKIGAHQKPGPDCIELDKMEKYHGC